VSRRMAITAVAIVAGISVTYWLFVRPNVADLALSNSSESIARGQYLVDAGGCVSCHEGIEHPDSMSGGLALESEFGTFYVPNITPGVATGIGNWDAQDFLLALKHGRSPLGSFYFPAFPYPAYAGLTDQDVLDIGAYLLSRPAVENATPAHEIPGWLARWMLAGWNVMAGFDAYADGAPSVDRGEYLARHLGHCGECHTPRNAVGILNRDRQYAGATLIEGKVDAIDGEALAEWSQDDFVLFLSLGLKPDGEFVGGEMEKVIEHNTSRLATEDKEAMAAYFLGSE